VAGGVDFVYRVKGLVLERHLHKVRLDEAAGVGYAVAGAVVVVEAAADLVAVVVEAWGGRAGGGVLDGAIRERYKQVCV
jgi:hypothetical protein